MGHSIVLVTVNYRLGPFGFLTLATEEAPGNAGLLDQQLALQWVQQNIDQFGGDPGRVTIAGESAGSFSATYHLLSPASAGLFHRVIGQSGAGGLAPAFHHWQAGEAERWARELALLVGCVQLLPGPLLHCLREAAPLALAGAELEVGLLSQPVVDGSFARQPFLPLDPPTAFQTGDFNREVAVLLGTNRNEGLLLTQPMLEGGLLTVGVPWLVRYWDTLGPLLLLQRHALQITDQGQTSLRFQ